LWDQKSRNAELEKFPELLCQCGSNLELSDWLKLQSERLFMVFVSGFSSWKFSNAAAPATKCWNLEPQSTLKRLGVLRLAQIVEREVIQGFDKLNITHYVIYLDKD